MPEGFITLCMVLLLAVGAVFILTGWFWFSFLRLDPKRAASATGNLIGFRTYHSTYRFANNYTDDPENGRGRHPVVTMKVEGETCVIAAAAPDYSLTGADVGKPVRVLYRQRFGILLLIDNEKSIRNYVRLKKTLLGCFLAVGFLMCVLGLALAILL